MRALLIIMALPLVASTIFSSEEIVHPNEAVCTVCFLMSAHEENKHEKVKGMSEFEGNFYYFCSENCKASFDEDPLAYIPPSYPQPLPEFNLVSLEGKTFKFESPRNKASLINFWATWCVICKKEIPHLQKLYEELSSQGLNLIGISIDDPKKAAEKVEKYVRNEKLTFLNYLDATDDAAWAKLRIKGIPVLYLVNNRGQIVQRWIGKTEPGEIRTAVTKLLSQ